MWNRNSTNRPIAVRRIAATKQRSQAGKNEPRISTAGACPQFVNNTGASAKTYVTNRRLPVAFMEEASPSGVERTPRVGKPTLRAMCAPAYAPEHQPSGRAQENV